MTKPPVSNMSASVRQRLLNKARSEGRVFQELATLYAMERFLYRLGHSAYAPQFILKGGLMTLTWAEQYGRVTRDIDLLGRGVNSIDTVTASIQDILAINVDDGVVFDPQSARGSEITSEAEYVGVRVSFGADLAGMKLRLQVDVGFGDAVVPAPSWLEYPQLLDLGAPKLLGYPAAATLAEKLHAVATRGLTNSRMKDYYDLWTAAQLGIVDAEELGTALRHTFGRRGTPLPSTRPVGLTSEFADDSQKQVQWKAFLRKSKLDAPPLAVVVESAATLASAGFTWARTEQE